MAPPKDKGALAILIGGPSKKKDEAADGGGDNYDEDLDMASQDLLDAIAKKDVSGVSAALRAAHDICGKG